MADLLLHSLAEFEPILLVLLDRVAAKTTVEIGVEEGLFSRALVDRADRLGGRHVGIDPKPTLQARSVFASANMALIEQTSVAALAGLSAMDAYFVDGDHNYRTVSEELILIQRAARAAGRPFPLVVLHDTGWPTGRRDLYYNPGALPPDGIHPFTHERGVTLDNPGTTVGGFRGEGRFAWARHEGGERNGVRTAIDDFLASRDLAFFEIPCIFGLGVVADSRYRAVLASVLAPYHDNTMLAKLEKNRLELYLRVLALQDEANALRVMLTRVGGGRGAKPATPCLSNIEDLRP